MTAAHGAPSDLTARLGLEPGARAIILNADDFGMCRAANRGVVPLLEAGHLDSATLMVPCAWAPEALAFAAGNPAVDVGVHLVLTSEWTSYRWRPLTGAGTSLVDAAGYFPTQVVDVETQATEADVAAELTAQLDAALAAGVDVSHLDNHMGSVYGLATGRSFLGPVLRLAAERGLPFRLPRSLERLEDTGVDPGGSNAQQVLDTATAAADELGVVIVDRLWTHPFALAGEGTDDVESYEDVKAGFLDLLRAVGPGVTEIFLHPMVPGDELTDAVDFAAPKRGYEARLLADPDVAATIAAEGLVRVAWRDLRAVQRGER
ncbi:polysaccharide deacetylase family protein [Isoptericola sp. NEAU-Y5]|uniref:Polysaccharide deacetylase family protein n=1 Tax=Isoptericola luteus TaxID=2879484 RepID=A0ABS7ZHM2_9MICO|nr:polysaccharide deacetylase family protein [Isoptericola sp. NEAU-Y5]MCA5894520.1 polysaccharide deacetylase family protein [Isoptericola sp. NEAU-Y5]